MLNKINSNLLQLSSAKLSSIRGGFSSEDYAFDNLALKSFKKMTCAKHYDFKKLCFCQRDVIEKINCYI